MNVNESILEYKDLSRKIKELEAKQSEIKEGLKATMEAEDVKKLVFSAGTVTLTEDSLSITYKAAILDGLCASSDEIKRMLWPHRTETVKKGYLMIR